MYVGQGPFYITFGGCVKSTFANKGSKIPSIDSKIMIDSEGVF